MGGSASCIVYRCDVASDITFIENYGGARTDCFFFFETFVYDLWTKTEGEGGGRKRGERENEREERDGFEL